MQLRTNPDGDVSDEFPTQIPNKFQHARPIGKSLGRR